MKNLFSILLVVLITLAGCGVGAGGSATTQPSSDVQDLPAQFVEFPSMPIEEFDYFPTVTRDGKTEIIENPFIGIAWRNSLLYGLPNIAYTAQGDDPAALAPNYEGYATLRCVLQPKALSNLPHTEILLYIGEQQALVNLVQDGVSRWYATTASEIQRVLAEVDDWVGRATAEQNPAYTPADEAFRTKALALGYSQEFLDFLKTMQQFKSGFGYANCEALLANNAEGVASMLKDFGLQQQFVAKLLSASYQQLTGLAQNAYSSPDQTKVIFEAYNPEEYISATYLLWHDKTTGQSRLLCAIPMLNFSYNPNDGILAVHNLNNLWFYDIATGKEADLFNFPLGTYHGVSPERIIVGMRYNGFAGHYLVAYAENYYGDWWQHKVYLAAYNRAGELVQNIDTGIIKTTVVKNWPSIVQIFPRGDGTLLLDIYPESKEINYTNGSCLSVEF